MTENLSLINIGDLTKPAIILIEKISKAVGIVFEPSQIRRIAQAEAEANKIKVLSQIEISEIQYHAIQRFVEEETKKQINIEEIIAKTLPLIEKNAHPQKIEDDWITNFFDKCRLISDAEMQSLWSKILAGEANAPGTYSKRTVNFLGSLDKADALLFQKICGFCWCCRDIIVPFIYDPLAEIYQKNGIRYNKIHHLDEIGLLSLDYVTGFTLYNLPKYLRLTYYDKSVDIEFEKENDNNLYLGQVYLSKIGYELAPICDSKEIPDYFNYIVETWKKEKSLSVSFPKKCSPFLNIEENYEWDLEGFILP